MKIARLASPLIPVLALACCTLSCGSGNGRRLQSITINATITGGQTQLVATGTFSASPTTVTPLPVFWFVDLPPAQYNLTTQPFVIKCPYPPPFMAIAPADP
ncbi:exported hypothetical protein [Candidatus Sulfotelmatobacter kueseliae]|uniref:Lipoprotein n=1 Tax=Candidatus Sulfotelmatobacter kueseliae TaxID=2042962 RepID=A0A2U3L2L0_9BACT|nr:exported hypothetical protein [Candidatus Sulfotelmatobacter kueseliae]